MPEGRSTLIVRAVVGASGGPRIISGTLQVLVRALLRGEGAAAAVGQPRMHHQLIPAFAFVEEYSNGHVTERVPEIVKEGLQLRGHHVRDTRKHSVTQLILQDPYSCRDRRKGGEPAGY